MSQVIMATNRFRKALIKGKSEFPRAHLRKKNQNIGIQVYKIQISYLHLGFYVFFNQMY